MISQCSYLYSRKARLCKPSALQYFVPGNESNTKKEVLHMQSPEKWFALWTCTSTHTCEKCSTELSGSGRSDGLTHSLSLHKVLTALSTAIHQVWMDCTVLLPVAVTFNSAPPEHKPFLSFIDAWNCQMASHHNPMNAINSWFWVSNLLQLLCSMPELLPRMRYSIYYIKYAHSVMTLVTTLVTKSITFSSFRNIIQILHLMFMLKTWSAKNEFSSLM